MAHVTMNDTMWSAFPCRILIVNHVNQLHRFTTRHTPNTICLVAPGKGRWDLLVIPPRTATPEALRLMTTADTPEGPSRPDLSPERALAP